MTLRDVAERAGVSVMTVSRALSGKADVVSPDTLDRCRKAAAELGYVPNLLARSLRGEQFQTICMYAEYLSSHHYLAECVDLVSREIEQLNESVILCQSLHAFHVTIRSLNLAGALVIAPPESFYSDPFGEKKLGPCVVPATVLLHSAIRQRKFTEISPDIEKMAFDAANHLFELGHKRIVWFGGPDHSDEPHWFALRRKGIKAALKHRGMSNDCFSYQMCMGVEDAAKTTKSLLNEHPDVTGIICINDDLAIAVSHSLRRLNIDVPDDISVIGCNNLPLGEFFDPPITTFTFDIKSMVKESLSLLLDRMANKNGTVSRDSTPRIKRLFPAKMIMRQSTAAPPEPSHTVLAQSN